MRDLGSLTAREVRGAILDLMPEHGRTESCTLLNEIAGKLGADRLAGDWRERDRFAGQVARALDFLAGEGLLRKVGRNTPMPGGLRSSYNHAYWFTPEAWDKYAEDELARDREKKSEAARWDRVRERMHALLGILVDNPQRPAVTALEQLLDRAEARAALLARAQADAQAEGR